MQTALILMTILGCDDSGTQCHYVRTLDQRWASIQSCDAEAENQLKGLQNLTYPVVVAVCQTPEDAGLAELATGEAPEGSVPAAGVESDNTLASDAPALDAPASNTQEQPGFPAQALARVRNVLPEAESIKALVSGPVHYVTDSYSWMAQRFKK